VALLLGACGTTEEPGTDAAAGPAGEQITLIDGRGAQVTLDGPATRTVGLEWNVVEHLVSLGVMPVGVADVEGYTNWVQAAPLDEGVTLARRFRDSGPARQAPAARTARLRERRAFALVTAVAVVLTVITAIGGLLLGEALLLGGDVLNWAVGRAGPVTTASSTPAPRVLAALLAGAALAVAGAAVQAVGRNPLAEPGLLGVSGGAAWPPSR
jgi:hypothetical protein